MTKLCTTNWFYIFATSESHNFSKWHRYSRNSLPHEPVRPSRAHSFFKNLKFDLKKRSFSTFLLKKQLPVPVLLYFSMNKKTHLALIQ